MEKFRKPEGFFLKRLILTSLCLLLLAMDALLIVLWVSSHTYSRFSVGLCKVSGSDWNLGAELKDEFLAAKLSGGFLVAKRDHVLAEGYCGLADPNRMTPVLPETGFNIGSVAKQFTGYLLLELVRGGKLELTQPLSVFLPELESYPIGKATIGQ